MTFVTFNTRLVDTLISWFPRGPENLEEWESIVLLLIFGIIFLVVGKSFNSSYFWIFTTYIFAQLQCSANPSDND